MILTATIAPKTFEPDGTRETRQIRAEGGDYEAAKVALEVQVPDGWRVLFIRRA